MPISIAAAASVRQSERNGGVISCRLKGIGKEGKYRVPHAGEPLLHRQDLYATAALKSGFCGRPSWSSPALLWLPADAVIEQTSVEPRHDAPRAFILLPAWRQASRRRCVVSWPCLDYLDVPLRGDDSMTRCS